MFYLILSKLGCGLGDDISLPWDDVVTCQLQMIDAMLKYTTRELSSNMWAIFMVSVWFRIFGRVRSPEVLRVFFLTKVHFTWINYCN